MEERFRKHYPDKYYILIKNDSKRAIKNIR